MTIKEEHKGPGLLPSTHIPRGCSTPRPDSARIAQLSTPRELKKIWYTSYNGPLVWGNQETIWPLNPATLSFTPTDRLKELAVPKTDHSIKTNIIPEYQYSCGRESQIWQFTKASFKAVPTARTLQLAKPKTAPPGFQQYFYLNCGRSSPISRPTSAAMNAKPRPRTAQLARPKSLHVHYQPPRQVQSIVTQAAQICEPSPRITELATPKGRPDGPFRDPEWPVSKGALTAEASQRLNELSRSKRLAEGYEPSKDVIWKVSNGVKMAVASTRLIELAKPIIRETMDHLQFNPDAFIVSEAAKKCKASSRIEELAQPIQR